MKKVLTVGLLSAALLAAGAGVASADTLPIWALPGLDVGSVLGPTVPVPTQVLAPVDGLLKLISG
ncbi:hypothetical protein [Kutzneria sp. CA-103260]|uniref:hypothetical protein n=1 Tax=Kutzneria sp. CA-103260 TaxID=2802641 RepID=UPI001BA9CB05|nr:hypothetical protein [Kutzneria sp. CA-103260]QUQ71137.1 hypothetical protein JJ691_89200 [Kutzneria sp. CA-103260]